LETLLVKFDKKTKGYRCSIWEFLEGYWEKHMSRIMESQIKFLENEEERARCIGVVICDSAEVEHCGGLEEGSWDWFEWEAGKIMMGV
jgi:hypothetical protein